MRISTPFFIVILLFTIISCKSEAEKTQERNAIVDSTIMGFQKKLLETELDSLILKNKFNGSVSVMQNGTMLYEKENGYQNFQQKIKLNRQTVFAIGSISKQFTAVLTLQNQEQGKLNVQDKVSKYLKDFQNKEYEAITIHQLLNHTSGLNDFGERLLFKSGTDYSYSNKGYLFLGEIVAKVSGKSFDENLLQLCQKAEMANSAPAMLFRGKHFGSAYIGNIANAQEVENMPNRLAGKSIGTAAGGLLATTDDLHQWNNALYSGKLISSESLALLQDNYITRDHYVLGKVGYGYGIMMNEQQPNTYFHTGYVKGAPSLVIYYPETKTSVVIFSNFANESLGKEAIFHTHQLIKNKMDMMEISVVKLRQEMLTKIVE